MNAAKLRSFSEMKESFKALELLKDNTLELDLKEMEKQHQRVFVEVLDLFNRFRLLLNLIVSSIFVSIVYNVTFDVRFLQIIGLL